MTIDELREVMALLADGLQADLTKLRQDCRDILIRCDDDLLLVKGDLSGIQNYLYSVNAAEDAGGGVAKRLRGRSFYLSAICHALADELTREAGYDSDKQPHTLHAAGGKFLVALPYTTEVEGKVVAWKDEIDRWLWTLTWGELYLNLAWRRCRSDELKAGFSEKVALPLQKQLDEGKQRKFLPMLRKVGSNNGAAWDSFPVFRGAYADECHSCRCLPVKQVATGEKENLCEQCLWLEDLGKFLKAPQRNKLDFHAGTGAGKRAITFHNNHAVLKKSSRDLPQIAGFVPQWPFHGIDPAKRTGRTIVEQAQDKINSLCAGCAVHRAQPGDCGEGKDRLVTRFHCLATLSTVGKDGADKIAVLAADGDEFSFHLNSTPGITLEDQVALGKLIYQFFGQRLIELLKERDGLLIYSGGDDLVFVGPWAEVIRVADQLRRDFAAWTKGRLHFSAGIHIANPHDPVYESISIAKGYQDQAKKESGKNAVQIEQTHIPWANFDAVFEFAEDLAEAKKTGVISMAFIYGLYRICEDRKRYEQTGEVRGLRYLSRLAAHISRNLRLDWDDAEKAGLAAKLKQSFEVHLLDPNDTTLLPYWRFALDWAALQGRDK
jgi:CRISPR-associated protein Csm1